MNSPESWKPHSESAQTHRRAAQAAAMSWPVQPLWPSQVRWRDEAHPTTALPLRSAGASWEDVEGRHAVLHPVRQPVRGEGLAAPVFVSTEPWQEQRMGAVAIYCSDGRWG